MKRKLVSSRDLKIGDNVCLPFLVGEPTGPIVAIGPSVFTVEVFHGRYESYRHMDVLVDEPRSTVGEFGVGERFTCDGRDYAVIACGEQFCFVHMLGPVRKETLMSHGYPCEEYKGGMDEY